jgi:diaminopimelate decarboxylase
MEGNIMIIKTPYYIFDKEKFEFIVKNYQKNAEVYYPVKANDTDIIIDTAIDLSCCFEADSIEHIKILKSKGVDADRILYSYPIREENDIKYSVELGLKKYVVDSTEEYEKIKKYLTDGLFFIRLNPVVILGLNLSPKQNKWGLSIHETKELIDEIRNDKGKVIGLSFYIFKEIHRKIDTLKKLLLAVRDNFKDYSLDYLNVGGGISADELTSLQDILQSTKEAIGAKSIIIEPGTPLLDPCIDMVVSVAGIKKANNVKKIFINAGIYNGLIDIIIKKRRFIVEDFLKIKNNDVEKTIICGSSSDVSDCLGIHNIRKSIKIGDQLIVKGTGAYSAVMQTGFCGKSKIKMIVKDNSL